MKKAMLQWFFTGLILLSGETNLPAQARLILNGASIRISNGASLVIENPDTAAITRLSGVIVSEGDSNNVCWYMRGNNGTYTIPWGYDTSYLPLRFTKSGGSANGYFSLSTYHTSWQNSQSLPPGVTKLLETATDNSATVLDRFWKIQANNYSTVPSLSNLIFTYPETEYTAPGNYINEVGLGAYRWNDIQKSWYDFVPVESTNVLSNTVTVSTVGSTDLYSWWILADMTVALPLDNITLALAVLDKRIQLSWQVEPDPDIRGFEIQRSSDNRSFSSIGFTAADAWPNTAYSFIDKNPLPGKNYYRVKVNYYTKRDNYSETRSANLASTMQLIVYPNPVAAHQLNFRITGLRKGSYTIRLYDAANKVVFQTEQLLMQENYLLPLPAYLKTGVYNLSVSSESFKEVQTVIIL